MQLPTFCYTPSPAPIDPNDPLSEIAHILWEGVGNLQELAFMILVVWVLLKVLKLLGPARTPTMEEEVASSEMMNWETDSFYTRERRDSGVGFEAPPSERLTEHALALHTRSCEAGSSRRQQQPARQPIVRAHQPRGRTGQALSAYLMHTAADSSGVSLGTPAQGHSTKKSSARKLFSTKFGFKKR